MQFRLDIKTLIALGNAALVLLPMTTIAATLPDFAANTQILTLPQVTVDGQSLLYDVELHLDFASGRFAVQKVSDTAPPDAVAEPRIPFQLAMGQSIVVSATGLYIQFSRIIEDSRCPAAVLCVWAGQAKVALTVWGHAANPEEIVLATGNLDTPSVQEVSGYRVELLGVQPYPQTPDPIPPQNYRVTLRVTLK